MVEILKHSIVTLRYLKRTYSKVNLKYLKETVTLKYLQEMVTLNIYKRRNQIIFKSQPTISKKK